LSYQTTYILYHILYKSFAKPLSL